MIDKDRLLREMADALDGLGAVMEGIAGEGHPLARHGMRLASRARELPASPAPSPPAPPIEMPDGLLEERVRTYFTTHVFPVRFAAQYDIQELLGIGCPKERAERRAKLGPELAQAREMRARAEARRS